MNTVGSRILMRMSFLSLITVVMIGVSISSSLVLFTTEAMSSVLPLPLADITSVFARSLPILGNKDV